MYMLGLNAVLVPFLKNTKLCDILSVTIMKSAPKIVCVLVNDVHTFWRKLRLLKEDRNKPVGIRCPPAVPVSYDATPAHWHGTRLARHTVRAFQLCMLHIQVV